MHLSCGAPQAAAAGGEKHFLWLTPRLSLLFQECDFSRCYFCVHGGSFCHHANAYVLCVCIYLDPQNESA